MVDHPADDEHPAVDAGIAAADASDSKSDTDIHSNPNDSFSPSNFRRLTTENAKEWLAYFEKHCTYKQYNEAKTGSVE